MVAGLLYNHSQILQDTFHGTVSATYTGNRRAGSYTYDSNGNLTADPDAGLSGMTYNALNRLSGYTEVGSGYQTKMEYTASGEKTSVMTLDGNGIVSEQRRYNGNVIYDGVSLGPTRLLIDGGYVDITSTFNSMSYAYRFYVQDHQGNNRMVTDASGTVLQVNHYDPYGQLLTSISSTSPVSQYKYGGKEWNSTSLSYDFGARNYLPALPRWNSMDPLAEKYYSISPYVYCAGNPVNLVDLDGERPIYSTEGRLLGTDDEGLQGEAIIMERRYFHQGMAVEEALKYDLGKDGLVDNDAVDRFETNYSGLSSRPDWDGYLTLEEANERYRSGNGAPLYVSLEKIDLSGWVSLGEHFVNGKKKLANLFFVSASINDALVYGTITLVAYPNHSVRAFSDTYDFRMKSWFNPTKWGRNIDTAIGKTVAGQGTEYEINIYGSKQVKPILPWIK